MAHARRLNQLIMIKGGSPVPFYESAVLPKVQAALEPSLVGRNQDLSQSTVWAALQETSLPTGWTSVFPPKKGLPQWAIEVEPSVVKTTWGFEVEESLRIYFGIATAKEVSPSLRSLYVRDLPLTDADPEVFVNQYDQDAAWLTLFVYLEKDEEWKVKIKPSHKVQGKLTLEGEVLGQELL